MRKFIVQFIIFTIPIIMLSYPIDYLLSYLISKSIDNHGEFEVWSDIYNHNANCEIAIYGSSRAWVHISPKILSDSFNQSVYNFGIDGHNFWLQNLRHLEYLRFNKKPKTIIYSVDMFTLVKRDDLYQPDQFLPYMLWNKNITIYTKSYLGYNPLDYYIPILRYAGKFDAIKSGIKYGIVEKPIKHYRYKGYKGMERIWNSDLDKAKENIKSLHINIDQKSLKLFEQFIKECISTNIELILVYTPEYIEGQNFVTNRKEVIDIYTTFSKKYNILFLDYSKNSICNDRDLFYNSSHLNKLGSEIFSKELAKDLKGKI